MAKEHSSKSDIAAVSDEPSALTAIDQLAAVADSVPTALFVYQQTRMIYANPSACELVGYSLDDITSMSFWQFIHPDHRELVKSRGLARQSGEEVPLQYQVRLVRKDGSIVWVDFSARVIDLDGRCAVLGIANDITRQKEAEQALRDRIAFDDVLGSISTSFIHLAPPDVDRGINDALRKIGEFADVDRTYVFLLSEDGTRMSNTHEWCRAGTEPAMDRLQDLPIDFVPWFMAQIVEGEVVHVPDVCHLPPEASAERTEWKQESIQSLLCVPLLAGTGLIGFVGFDSVRKKKHWAEEFIALLRDFGDIVSNLLQRKKAADLTATNERLREEIRERERVQQKLREQGELLGNILSNIPYSVFWKDRASRYLGCNRRFALRAGCESPEQVIGRTDDGLGFTKEETEFHRQSDQTVLESGEAILNREVSHVGPNDAKLTLLTSKVPLRGGDGCIVGVVGMFMDITEIKAAEAALRESEQRLQGILEFTTAVIYAKDLSGRYILTNQRFAEIAGRPCDETVGMTDGELFPQDVAERFVANDRRVIETRAPVEVEEVVPRADGLHTYISQKFPLYDNQGEPYAVCGISTDISERKKVEEDLVSRLHYEEHVALCSQTLLSGDDAKVALVNTLQLLRVASDTARVSLFEVIEAEPGHHSVRRAEVVCAPGRDATARASSMAPVEAWWLRLLRGEAVWGTCASLSDVECDMLKEWHVQSVLLVPVTLKSGLYGYLRFDDITTERDWTSEDVRLLHTAANMIGTFLERHRAQEDLRLAKEVAESASRTKSRLLANLSHEIRTPITAILGAAELLPSAAMDVDEIHRRVDMISRNGRHLLSLIDDLLDLSRIEANELSLQIRRCSLLDILADIQAATAPLHQGRSFEYEFRFHSDLPSHVATDPTRLKQAVINLVSNALKFTDEGHVYVHVGVDCAGEGCRLVFVVEDTGIGIPPSDSRRVFESFQRGEHPKGRSTGGVGLGLPLARWIAERLGGTLHVESTIGQGSTFTMAIELGSLLDVEWISPASVLERLGRQSDWREIDETMRLTGRVLVAEDSEDVRHILQAALERAGVDVTTVSDGADAVCLATDETFDLILMDVLMPHMDGVTAAKTLRDRGCRTPIVALTALSAQADAVEMAKAGFDDCWAKPISFTQLMQVASAYLHKDDDKTREGAEQTHPSRASEASFASKLQETVAAFERSLPDRLRELKSAIGADDRDGAYHVLHQLAGTSGICGHMGLSEESRRLLARFDDVVADHTFDSIATLAGMIDTITTPSRRSKKRPPF